MRIFTAGVILVSAGADHNAITLRSLSAVLAFQACSISHFILLHDVMAALMTDC